MKKWSIFSIALVFIFTFAISPVAAAAQQQQDDRIVVKKSDLPPEVVKQIETKQKMESYGSWVGLGKEVGQAFNEGLTALTEQADKFAKTGVGRFTMLMIAWKVMGKAALQVGFGIIFFIVGFIFFVWSWYLNGRTRKIKTEKNEKGQWKYQVVKPSDAAQLGYAVWFMAFIGVTCLIIFA